MLVTDEKIIKIRALALKRLAIIRCKDAQLAKNVVAFGIFSQILLR